MKILLCFYLVLAASSVFAQTSYVPSTQVLKSKGYQIGVGLDYFMTTKPVDEDGKGDKFADGEKFQRAQVDFMGYYGATSQLQLGLGARLRQNASIYSQAPADGSSATEQEYKAVQNGFQSTAFSIMYAFKPVDRLQYTLEGLFRYVPYTNTDYNGDQSKRNQEDIVLGDEGNEYSGGLGVTYSSLTKNYLTVRGGVRRPGSDLSGEIYYQAEGALVWKNFALLAGLDGVSSLKNSNYKTSTDSDYPIMDTANTRLYNSINREWIAPYLGANVAINKDWRVELKGTVVASGRSTDLGTGFGINLVRRVDKNETRAVDSKFKTYDVEVTITKISPKRIYVVVDKGMAEDVNKGMVFDFFEFDYVGGNVLVARGVVIKAKSETSIVKITQRFNVKKDIKEGLIGRAYYR